MIKQLLKEKQELAQWLMDNERNKYGCPDWQERLNRAYELGLISDLAYQSLAWATHKADH